MGSRPTPNGRLFHNLGAEIETLRPLCQGSRTKPSGAATSKQLKAKRISCIAQAASGGRGGIWGTNWDEGTAPGAKHHHITGLPLLM